MEWVSAQNAIELYSQVAKWWLILPRETLIEGIKFTDLPYRLMGLQLIRLQT
jgi:hypothetical protein